MGVCTSLAAINDIECVTRLECAIAFFTISTNTLSVGRACNCDELCHFESSLILLDEQSECVSTHMIPTSI